MGPDGKVVSGAEIQWTDEAIEQLLDRSQIGKNAEEAEAEGKDWVNEYLDSFKVATYVTNPNVEQNGNLEVEENEKENEKRKGS